MTSQQVNDKLRAALQELSEELSSLQMMIKYQTFDLEATRRERDLLKERLKKYEDEKL
jgi:hypothetical protein